MIKLFFKFCLFFWISFFLLSFPIKEQPLFYHVSEVTGPFTRVLFKELKKGMRSGAERGSEIGKKLFSNSSPLNEHIEKAKEWAQAEKNDMDFVQFGHSSTLRKAEDLKEDRPKPGNEDYSDVELEQLRALIKESQY